MKELQVHNNGTKVDLRFDFDHILKDGKRIENCFALIIRVFHKSCQSMHQHFQPIMLNHVIDKNLSLLLLEKRKRCLESKWFDSCVREKNTFRFTGLEPHSKCTFFQGAYSIIIRSHWCSCKMKSVLALIVLTLKGKVLISSKLAWTYVWKKTSKLTRLKHYNTIEESCVKFNQTLSFLTYQVGTILCKHWFNSFLAACVRLPKLEYSF